MTLIYALLIFCLLIFFHELGHFTLAKLCGADGVHVGQDDLSAAEARRLLHSGLPVTGRLTPLARDVLEGRA